VAVPIARPRGSWALAAYLVLPLVLGAALWLAHSSWRHAEDVARRASDRERVANRELAGQIVGRIEDAIIDADRTLFNLVDPEKPEFKQLWQRIVKVSPSVEAAAVLDAARKPIHFITRDKKEGARLEPLFRSRIVPDLELATLGADDHKHLHTRYDGRPALVSYLRRDSGGETRFVALKWNVDHLKREVIERTLSALGDRRRSKLVGVVGPDDRSEWGDAIRAVEGSYDLRFPTTFYDWRLRVAPRWPDRDAVLARKRARAEVVLVAVSAAVCVAGLLVLGFAVRKERALGQLRSDFIANLSHELKTPLSLIRMFSELIALGKLKDSDSARQYGEIILRESDRLARLIDNVMDFSRIERGQKLEMRPGDLGEVVERVLDIYRPRLEREQVRLETRIEPALPQVRMDPNAIALVLLNLVENAFKYGDAGAIAVRLGRQNGHVLLQVEDHGPGIPPGEQKRVFDRFYRIKSDRTRAVRGTGIGLSLVRQIAEAHGGRVTLDSQPGRGSTFTVSLPAADPAGTPS
jgi:two-component system phosphate regulon sensor histidine kinase PhoR